MAISLTRRRLVMILLLAVPLALVGCNESESQTTQRDRQEQESRRAAESLQFVDNAERENIVRRHQLTGDPGLLGYIVLLNESGVPILYETVRGKVTTSGSRLTAPDRVVRSSNANGGLSQVVVRAPSDTGTFDTGTARFIFYFTSDGQYRQWSGHYLYSTNPIRLRIEPMVVNISPTPAR